MKAFDPLHFPSRIGFFSTAAPAAGDVAVDVDGDPVLSMVEVGTELELDWGSGTAFCAPTFLLPLPIAAVVDMALA